MPSTRRWSVSHQRIEISVALGTIGTFLICGGIGMTNWVVSGFGVGLIAGGASIFGLSAINSRSPSYIIGMARVVRATDPHTSQGFGRCHIVMVVHAKNINGLRVKVRDDRVPINKWPTPGDNLPARIDVYDPRRVRVLWDEVPTHVQATAARAEEEAAAAASFVGEPAFVATAEGGGTGFGPTGSGYRAGYDGTGPLFEDPGDLDTADVAGTEPTMDMSDEDIEAELSGSVLEFDIDGLVVPADADGLIIPADSTAEATPPPRRKPSPRPRRALDDTDLGNRGTARPARTAKDTPATPPATDGYGSETTRGADDPAAREDGAAAAGPPAEAGSTPPHPRLPADDALTAFTDELRVNKKWDIPDTPEQPTDAPAAAAPPPDVTPPEPEVPAHPVLRVDQAHVVTERVKATPDRDSGTRYDQDDDDSDVATVYLATSPPPGTPRRGGIRSVAATMLVTDLDRSIAFYRDVLGFTERASGYSGVLLVSGEARIVLRVTSVPEPVDRRLVQLLLEVPDVDAAYRDLRDRGVSFIHRPRPVSQYQQLTLWAAAMHDPDGHGIAIAQWRPNH